MCQFAALDLELLDSLAADDFGCGERKLNSIALMLPLSLIDKQKTGFLNNVSLVIQKAENYTGALTAETHNYSSYPYDYYEEHVNPISGVSWPLLVSSDGAEVTTNL